MNKSQKDLSVVPHTTELNPKLLADVRKSIVVIRDIRRNQGYSCNSRCRCGKSLRRRDKEGQ